MRRVRTALFLVLYRVIPSCHSWGFSPIAPSWGCPKGLKTKIWPELQFCDYGLSQGAKAQIAAQNRSKSVVEQPPSALRMRERSPQSQKKAARKPRFLFSQRADSYDRNETIRKTREIPSKGKRASPQKKARRRNPRANQINWADSAKAQGPDNGGRTEPEKLTQVPARARGAPQKPHDP